MSATEYLIDASTRHQIMLQRLSGGAFNKLKPILEQLQKDVKARLRDDPTDFQMHRLTALSADIQALFDEANTEFGKQLSLELNDFTEYETDFQYRMLGNAVTTELTLPAIEQVVAAVTTAKAELISGGVTKRLTISEMVETLGTKPVTIENKIRAGIIEGKSVDQMVRDIMRIADKVNKRDARTIVRTAFNLAGSEARRAVNAANSDVLIGERLIVTLDSRTSVTCYGLSVKNIIYKIGEGPQPPLHFQCLPWDTNISTCSPISNIYKRAYKGVLVNVRTKSGRTLSATPNHPILTTFGWVAIGEINLGDKLFCCNDVIETFKDNKQNIIAKIGEIFSAGYVSVDPRFITSAPSSAKDFHGDGSDSEVEVISIDSLSGHKIKSALSEKIHDDSLPSRSLVDSTFLACCGLEDLGISSGPSAAGNVCSSGEVGYLFRSGSSHPSELLLTSVSGGSALGEDNSSNRVTTAQKTEMCGYSANSDARIVSVKDGCDLIVGKENSISVDDFDSITGKNAPDWRSVASENLPDFLTANFIDGIELDDVVDLFVSEFTETHVYNLENENNWYVANGIITHNCRSLRVGVVDPRYAVPGIQGLKSARGDSGVEKIDTDVTFDQFLKNQSVAFQKEFFYKFSGGHYKYEAWKAGKISGADFVDGKGAEIDLSYLKSLDSITL